MKQQSYKLASIIGPTLVVLAISEFLNFEIWSNIDPTTVHLNGLLLFIAGLSIIRSHRIWRGWPVLITLVGWIALLLGTYRMLFPEGQQAEAGLATNLIFLSMITVGGFLSYKAYYSR